MKISTIWGENLDINNPLPEYPRPQFERESFFSLNGVWDYCITKDKIDLPVQFDGKIVVPFSPESDLSGVNKTVMPDDTLFYERTFELPQGFVKNKVFINFGAVDYLSKVYINDKLVGENRGGYNPFSFDITSKLKNGKNKITVAVTDPSDTGTQSRGKQVLKPWGIWYTPSSGIWQTVWLESVPEIYVEKIKITPDIDSSSVNICVTTNKQPKNAQIRIFDNKKEIINVKYIKDESTSIIIANQKLWSPESPHLYNVEVICDNDTIYSYFGQRKFSTGFDKQGFNRLFLNNKPYFHNGLLDQGYWCDGLYTAPSDEALIYDIKLAKDLGYNMLRKHIKIEPYRWYYHCDRLGMIVWQDMVNGGSKYNLLKIAVLPFLGVKCDDRKYNKLFRKSLDSRNEFIKDLTNTVEALYNVVSIGVWVIFNEAWGQFESIKITEILKQLDSTRTIDPTSGWYDQKGQDVKSVHCYFYPFKMPKKEKRPVVLSEYGGYSHQVKGHVFTNKVFGYRVYKCNKKLNDGYKKLIEKQIIPAKEKGLAAAVYTQISDVESEINGIVTYDRKVLKFDKQMIKSLNKKLIIDD